MATRMQHPEHGFTHAYDIGEVARLEKLGWSVERPAPQVLSAYWEKAGAEIAALAPQKKKPGPKPKAK